MSRWPWIAVASVLQLGALAALAMTQVASTEGLDVMPLVAAGALTVAAAGIGLAALADVRGPTSRTPFGIALAAFVAAAIMPANAIIDGSSDFVALAWITMLLCMVPIAMAVVWFRESVVA